MALLDDDRVLIAAQRRAAEMGGGIELAALRPLVRKTLDTLGADRILRSAPTVVAGAAALR